MSQSPDTVNKDTAHATIVISRDVGAAKAGADSIASAMLCTAGGKTACGKCRSCRLAAEGIHPDIIYISRQKDDKGKLKREIYVDQIRQMAADAWVLPQESEKKVYIIPEAHKMNVQAQNAALKILEEPPEWAAFILCTESAERLLPTVRSRCAVVEAKSERAFAPDPRALDFLKLAAAGDPAGLCAFWVELESMDADGLGELLDNTGSLISAVLLGSFRFDALSPRELKRLLDLCGRGRDYLKLNVSVKHVLGLMNVLSIQK